MSEDTTPAELGDGWLVGAPEQHGMAPAMLSWIGPRSARWPAACAHAVVGRRGALVYEQYFSGEDCRWATPIGAVVFDATVKHDLKSITKSVHRSLVGTGLDRGWIVDIDTPVFSYFPDHADMRTPEKERITLAHLLTMSTGLDLERESGVGRPGK